MERVQGVGTGLGAMLMSIARRWPEKKLFALDISYVNMKAVRGKVEYFGLSGDIYLVVGDALNMPFKGCAFDVVESWFGIGNIAGFSEVVRQAYRVLKLGGRLTVSGAWGDAFLNLSVYGRVEGSLTSKERGELIGFLRRMELMLNVDEVVETFKRVGFYGIKVYEERGLYVVTGVKPA